MIRKGSFFVWLSLLSLVFLPTAKPQRSRGGRKCGLFWARLESQQFGNFAHFTLRRRKLTACRSSFKKNPMRPLLLNSRLYSSAAYYRARTDFRMAQAKEEIQKWKTAHSGSKGNFMKIGLS